MAYGCVLSCVLAGIVAVVLMAWAGYTRMDDETKRSTPYNLVPLAAHELTAASIEHNALLSLASTCPEDPKDIQAAPQILDLVPAHGNPSATMEPRRFPGYLMATVYLSNAIGRARVEAASAVAYNDQSRQVLEWAIVLIGMGSTVLVSLKSAVSNKSSVSFALSILAIVSSALATSASSLNAFYAPRIEYEKSQHMLTSLQHLHVNLVAGMTREAGVVINRTSVICGPVTAASWDKDWRLRSIRTLTNQFQTILASANGGISGTDSLATDEQFPTDPSGNPPPNRPNDVRTARK